MAVCYPYHPLFGHTVAIVREEKFLGGEGHFRIVTESGEGTLVPVWMLDPNTFDASPIERPLIDADALLDLHALVASALSSLDAQVQGPDKEDESHGTTAPVSRSGGQP